MRLLMVLAMGYALLVLRSTVMPVLGLSAIGPDLVFPMAVFYGATNRTAEGVVTALVLGHAADLMAGGGHGVHVFLYALGFVLASLLAGRIDVDGIAVPVLTVFVLSLVAGLSLTSMYNIWSLAPPRPAGGALVESALTALCAIPLLPALRALRRMTERQDTLPLPD